VHPPLHAAANLLFKKKKKKTEDVRPKASYNDIPLKTQLLEAFI
jgi:hypothetical protein